MPRQSRTGPVDGSYWVQDKLLAGEYPSGWNEARLRAKLRRLLRAGVTFFLDLTEEGEKGLPPYAPLLHGEATTYERVVEHCRMPIPDFDTPTVDEMRRILDTLDAALEAGHTVYVHCYAGVGRTGTVVGCHLVRHGLSGQGALDELARLRRGTYLDEWLSPVTAEQRQMVLDWAALEDVE